MGAVELADERVIELEFEVIALVIVEDTMIWSCRSGPGKRSADGCVSLVPNELIRPYPLLTCP